MHGTSSRPSKCAARTRPSPAIIESLAVGAWILGTGGGVVQPHSLMLAAIAATWASVWTLAFFAYGISRSIPQRSTLSAGHGL